MKYKSCFLGIPLPDKFLKDYLNLQENIKKIEPNLRLQDPKVLEPHITIYYCGEQEETVLSEISKIVESSKNLLANLNLKVGGLDFFDQGKYYVLFLDVVYPKELIIFQEEINNKCSHIHRDNEILAFHPHMTVGGFNTNRPPKELEQIMEKLQQEFSKVNLEFPISELIIYGVDPEDPTRSHKRLTRIPI